MNLDQAGDKLLDMMFQTIAGRMTAAEALKQNQFVMTVCTKRVIALEFL